MKAAVILPNMRKIAVFCRERYFFAGTFFAKSFSGILILTKDSNIPHTIPKGVLTSTVHNPEECADATAADGGHGRNHLWIQL